MVQPWPEPSSSAKSDGDGSDAGDGAEDDEVAEFDEAEFIAKYDEDNPAVDVPEEILDDVDNDYNIEDEDPPESENA